MKENFKIMSQSATLFIKEIEKESFSAFLETQALSYNLPAF